MEEEEEEEEEEKVTSGRRSPRGSTGPSPPPPPPPAAGRVDGRSCPIHRPVGQAGSDQRSSEQRLKSASTIRQHYYPEGGWGWLICACAFVVHLLTTGLQLAYGVLYLHAVQHFGQDYVIQAGWLGAFSMSVSHFLSPCVIAVCQRKSTRLTAVFGGLVMALACLFTSFAQQMHQTFVSYGLVLGLGVGMCRETANLMVGQYFKRRREAVEMIVQTGSGIGAAIFSVLFREAIGAVGWRLGLQAVTGVLFTSFVVGMLYRSATLYHPQRRAILHLKYQKKKVKDKSGRCSSGDKPPYVDLTTLKTRTLQIIMVSTGISSLGIYAPVFYLAVQCQEEGLELSSIVVLQTFLGFAFALGNVGFGLVVIRHSEQCFIARQYLLQASLAGLSMAILALATITGYHGYVLFVWMYGLFLGGYHFSLKVYTYEKTRARHFTRAWGFVQWAKALPVLFGVPITGYINRGEGSKVGFYFASAFALVGAACLFLMNLRGQKLRRRDPTVTFSTIESRVIPPYVHPPPLGRLDKNASFATSADGPDPRGAVGTGNNDATFDLDDEYYACDCITSCDKVERAFVFSEYGNDLREEEEEEEEGEEGGGEVGVTDQWGRPIEEVAGGRKGGANAWGGVEEREGGKKEPIGEEANGWGGATGRGRDKRVTIGDGGGGVSAWGGVEEWEGGKNEPVGEGVNGWGGANGRGRGRKGPIRGGERGGADDRGRGKKELMAGEALVEEEEEEEEDEEEKEEEEEELEKEVEEEEKEKEAKRVTEEVGLPPQTGRGRGPRGRRRRRSSITVVEEMTTSV